MNNVYASVNSPLPYLYNVYKGNVTDVNISSFEGCCPSGHESNGGNGGEVIPQSIWKDSKKHLNLIIKNEEIESVQHGENIIYYIIKHILLNTLHFKKKNLKFLRCF